MTEETLKIADVGKIHPRRSLFLRIDAGKASDDEHDYELSQTPNGCMVVRSETSGRWFILSWQDALSIAVARGINDTVIEKEPTDHDG